MPFQAFETPRDCLVVVVAGGVWMVVAAGVAMVAPAFVVVDLGVGVAFGDGVEFGVASPPVFVAVPSPSTSPTLVQKSSKSVIILKLAGADCKA